MIVTAILSARRPDTTFPMRDRSRVASVVGDALVPAETLSFVRPIIAAFADAANCSKARFLSGDNRYTTSIPRQTAMWAAYHLTMRSLSDIGEEFTRHHSTVIHAVRRTDERLEEGGAERQYITDVLKESLTALKWRTHS